MNRSVRERTVAFLVATLLPSLLMVPQAISEPVDSAAYDKSREEAEKLGKQAADAENRKEYATAAGLYGAALKIYPASPVLVRYRLGVCLLQLGKEEEAASTFKVFLDQASEAALPEKVILEAKVRLEQLLIPRLDKDQQEKLEEVDDIFQVVSKEPELSKELLPKAVSLLSQLKKDVPRFLPLYHRLGIAYETLGDYKNALSSYKEYLDGYKTLGFTAPDFRNIRKRRLACEARIALDAKKQKEEEVVRLRKQQEEDVRKKAEAEKAEKIKTLTTPDTITFRTSKQVFDFNQTISIDGNTLIIEKLFLYPQNLTGGCRFIFRINLTKLDANEVKLVKTAVNNRYVIFISTLQKAMVIDYESWSHNKPQDPLERQTSKHYTTDFTVDGEAQAKKMATALQQLIKLSK